MRVFHSEFKNVLKHIVGSSAHVKQFSVQHWIASAEVREFELRHHFTPFWTYPLLASLQIMKDIKNSLIENTRTMPSMVTLTTRSPSSALPPSPGMSWTPMFTVVCWPNRTIFVPARQSQHTRALSAPADTRFFDESATARIPFRWPASCCKGVKVTDEKRCTRLFIRLLPQTQLTEHNGKLTQHRGSPRQKPLKERRINQQMIVVK